MESFFWTPLKPQHSKPNPNPLANQLWCIDFLNSPAPLTIPHWVPAFLESFMPLKNWLMQDTPKAVWSIPYVSVTFFPSLKQNFIAYRSSKVSDCIFEIYQLWKSGFKRVYSNSCCSFSFEPEIIKIGKSSHKMYCNNILHFQESTTILKAHAKKCLCIIQMSNLHQWSGRPWFNPKLSHTKDSKMVLDATLLNSQHYMLRIKGAMEQSKKSSSTFPYTSV